MRVPGLFTVVGTVYGREYFVPLLIDCLMQQTYQHWELLLYADGPHLGTRALVTKLLAEVPSLTDKLQYFEHLPKPGAFGNLLRYRGLHESRGEFVCFTPHDCLLWPEYLETHARAMSGGLNMSVVRTSYWTGWSDNYHPLQARVSNPISTYLGVFPFVSSNTVQCSHIDLTCMAFPTEVAIRCGVFGRDIAMCYEADYLSFDRVRSLYPIVESVRVLASHF